MKEWIERIARVNWNTKGKGYWGGKPLPSRQRVINVWVTRQKRPSISRDRKAIRVHQLFFFRIYAFHMWQPAELFHRFGGKTKKKKQTKKTCRPLFRLLGQHESTAPRQSVTTTSQPYPNCVNISTELFNNNNRESSPFARATVQLNFKWTSWHQRKKEEGKRCYIYARLNIIVPLLGRDIRLMLRLGENGKTKVEDRFRIEPLD